MPSFLLGGGEGGGGGGLNFLPSFQKWGLDRTCFLEEVAGNEGWLFSGVGYNFSTKNKLKSAIFLMTKKVYKQECFAIWYLLKWGTS